MGRIGEEKVNMNILHVLQMSLPYTCGASIRSGYICKYQKEFAKVFVYTTFQYKSDKNMDIIDGIPYFRTNKNISFLLRFYMKLLLRVRKVILKIFNIYLSSRILELPLSFFTKRYVKKIIKIYDIDLIHQYTQSSIGNYCLEVARKLNIPFIYSFRGFSEAGMLTAVNMRRLSDKKTTKFMYKKLKDDETNILKSADYVSTLSELMRNILVKRGISKEKILVIPNSVDHILLKHENNRSLKEKLLLDDYLVIGHFGRLRAYEGIEILLKALGILIYLGKKVKLIIVGDIEKKYLNYLNTVIEDEDLRNNIIFIERVSHTEIKNYYSIVDIIVIPRLNRYECRMVTPLKPLDAMICKKLVIASDLPALRYTITPYVTGLLFKPGDPNDLAFKILEYINYPKMCRGLVNHAYNNVLQNFTWEFVVPKYEEVYSKLISEVKI
ncbi:hypothetical protein LCGC14_0546550 [marine sediment metagenome]|uniref:Glycosyltransferase subfamily 4-like N-terminal domain-containing protein n=1 Tax=marine sediment metagenome TaxID=412755 RepID=A0A0F9RR70_9ZZZZ